MYLENSEKTKASGEGEPMAEATFAEQCQVSTVTEAAEGSARLGVKVLAEYAEQTVVSSGTLQHDNSSEECVELDDMNRESTDETEPCAYCNEPTEALEQYPTSDEFLKSLPDECETAGLSQPSDECGQHCECFKPCNSSEHCANHSLASKCSSCCEHCAEHLQLFQQCEPCDRQIESFEAEPENLPVNPGENEMSSFKPERRDHFTISLQEYEDSDQRLESDTSRVDLINREQCEMIGFTVSMDLMDCNVKLECSNDYDRTCPQEQKDEPHETESSDGDSSSEEELSEDVYCPTVTPAYLEDHESESYESESCETDQGVGSDFGAPTDDSDMIENDDFETSQETEVTQPRDRAEELAAFCAEEDCASDCSSIETKSFKTCLEGSIPYEPYSDSSEESEKGGQGDSSDEQTLWESFEEDEETIQQTNTEESNNDQKKTPTVDTVIEDYFDLFDRADYFGHSPRRPYISCFDGGDVHDGLHHEAPQAEAQKWKNTYKCEEINTELSADDACLVGECDSFYDEDAAETSDASFGSSETEKQEEDVEVESDLADSEEHCAIYQPEDDVGLCAVCEGQVSDDCNEDEAADAETDTLSSCTEDSMCPPCAEDISVEGDAYEDDAFDTQNDEWLQDSSCVTDGMNVEESGYFHTSESTFIACSETEPYWVLIDNEEVMYDPGVEEYYAYELKSIQASPHEALNEFLEGLQSTVTRPQETKAVRFGIIEVIELNEKLVCCSTKQDSDCCLEDRGPPLGIIHSVVSEQRKINARPEEEESEHSRDSEEDESDNESLERCECEYCIPPKEQVPAEALLPQTQTEDTGKICLVIDLDETLVHSSFKPMNDADFTIPVEIEGTVHQVYVLKRPHVDEFLKRMGELFECVLFTASLSKYADPVSDLLDKCGSFRSRLFRESCIFHKGNYVKDLSRLGRDLKKVIIIDNSPASYIFHPDNAVPVASWFDDMSDTELLDLIPFFERLSRVDDIYDLLQQQQQQQSTSGS